MNERSQRVWWRTWRSVRVSRVVTLFVIGGGLLGVSGSDTTLGAQQPRVAARGSTDDTQAANEALSRPITVTLQKVSLKQAVDSIARIAKVFVQYRAQILRAHTTPVTIHAEGVPLGIVFERVLDGTNLRVRADGQGDLAIVPVSGTEADSVPAQGTVRGHVVDSATGRGLSGVTIKVVGTKIAIMTEDSGRFVLRGIPTGTHLLTAKIFGYRPGERTVDVTATSQASVRIVLATVPTVLSGVVTTATGTQRKIEVGSDITTLNVDSIMKVAPITSVTNLLESRVPGLAVVHSSGVPGDPSRLRLRGVSSIQLNNDPILIVDGVRVYASQSDPRNSNLAPSKGSPSGGGYNTPSPLDQIDPNSIETVEVLKGPSASAIYGSDAAAGVIVITTKHGRAGPAHWNLALGAGVNWLPGSWPVNYHKFGTSEKGSTQVVCNWYDISCVVDSVVAFQALNDSRYTIFSHGGDQTATLTVSGGSQTLLYSFTGSGSGSQGYLRLPASEQARYNALYGRSYGKIPGYLVRPDHYKTWSTNGSVTANVSPTFSVVGQSSLFKSAQQHSALESAILQLQSIYISPTFGTYGYGINRAPGVPLISKEFERATDDQLSTTNAATVRWQPWPWLPINATGGVNTIQRHDVTYIPFGIYDGDYAQFTAEPVDPSDTAGNYGLGRGSSLDQTLNVGTTMPLFRRRINLAVGGNVHTASTEDFAIAGSLSPGVSAPTVFNVICNSTTNCSNGSQSTSHQSTYGWYVEPQLALNSRFFAAPGFRLDGGSGGSRSSGSFAGLSGFPKMDFSYVAVDREDGDPLWGILTLLRPRLAFGLAGTQPRAQDKLRLYNVGAYNVTTPGQGSLISGGTGGCIPTVAIEGTDSVPAVCLNSLGNTQLRPERSSEIEGGFDATLWRNRVSLTVTQYNKTRHDAILAIPVAPSVFGYQTFNAAFQIQKNIGVIRNTGTEITANAQLLQRRALGWSIGANLSNDKNVVVQLNKGQNPIVIQRVGGSAVQERVQAGFPLFGVFTRSIAGFADANQDQIIEPNEIVYGDSAVYLGEPNPKYQFNLTSDVALLEGRLTVHTGFAYQNGMTQINTGGCTSGALPLLMNQPGVSLATQAGIVAADCGGFLVASNLRDAGLGSSAIGLVQRINTFRFNELSINYTIPRVVAQWFRAPRMSVALQGSNLALHTNYRGFDPNVNAFSTVSAVDATADNGQIPEPRTWWLRLTLGN